MIIKCFLSAFLGTVTLNSYSQVKVGTYNFSDLKRKMSIRAYGESSENLILYLEVFNGIPQDRYFFKIGSELESFTGALKMVKEKFSEWQAVAKKDGTNVFVKRMDIFFPTLEIVEFDPFDKSFTFVEALTPGALFSVLNGVCKVQVSALSKRYKNRANSIVFVSVKEIDTLIQKISPETLMLKLSKRNHRRL